MDCPDKPGNDGGEGAKANLLKNPRVWPQGVD